MTDEHRTPVSLSGLPANDPHLQPAARNPSWSNASSVSASSSARSASPASGRATGLTLRRGSSAPRSVADSCSSASASSPGASTSCRADRSSKSATRSRTRSRSPSIRGRHRRTRRWRRPTSQTARQTARWGNGHLRHRAMFPLLRSLGPLPKTTMQHTDCAPALTSSINPVAACRWATSPWDRSRPSFPRAPRTRTAVKPSTRRCLIRVSNEAFTTMKGRETWAPHGYVAYSKVCTHLGCPVGLYEQELQLLVCPCHQSMFNVTNGAVPQFGPAPRTTAAVAAPTSTPRGTCVARAATTRPSVRDSGSARERRH